MSTQLEEREREDIEKTERALDGLQDLYEWAKIGAPSWSSLADVNARVVLLKDIITERRSFHHTIYLLVKENDKQRELYIRRLRKKDEKIAELKSMLPKEENNGCEEG